MLCCCLLLLSFVLLSSSSSHIILISRASRSSCLYQHQLSYLLVVLEEWGVHHQEVGLLCETCSCWLVVVFGGWWDPHGEHFMSLNMVILPASSSSLLVSLSWLRPKLNQQTCPSTSPTPMTHQLVYYGVGLPSWHRLLPLSQIHTLKQTNKTSSSRRRRRRSRTRSRSNMNMTHDTWHWQLGFKTKSGY